MQSVGLLNRIQYPSDVIALVVFWRLRCKLALRDPPEMFLITSRIRPVMHQLGLKGLLINNRVDRSFS